MNVNSKLFTAAVGDFYYGINSIRCSVIVINRCLQFWTRDRPHNREASALLFSDIVFKIPQNSVKTELTELWSLKEGHFEEVIEKNRK